MSAGSGWTTQKKARRRTRMRSIADCDTGKHVCPRGCDAGDTTNQSVQNHCESSCNENKCEGTARLFDCKTRHRSDVLPCEGERARRNHSSEGLAPPGIGWTCVKAFVRNTRGEQVLLVAAPRMFVSENDGYVTVSRR